MINVKEESKDKQSNIIKEETKEFLDNQRQQLKNTTTSTISESTNKVNDNINEYQRTNKANLEKSIDTANKYQQETSNTIQSISNNTIELQNNILKTYQSIFSQFLDNVSKSYWNNLGFPERYADTYNKNNQNVTDNTINCTRRLNEFVLGSIESFNKSIEIAQKYYNESVQNYFNFVNKIFRSYYNR
jgi:hypothetical protein